MKDSLSLPQAKDKHFRPVGKSDGPREPFHPRGKAQQHWKRQPRCSSHWAATICVVEVSGDRSVLRSLLTLNSEALHGIATSPGVSFANSGNYSSATSFPQPILMGAAFDDELIRDVATVVSTEARAFSNAGRAGLNFWTPNINPFKDPRWGRGQETPGEDPFHLSSYVHALIDGLQGGLYPETRRVTAGCKHFAAYDMESWNGNFRYQWDAQVSSQDLAEYYMPPFQSCARDSNVGSFMCSYNSLNGVPTCADPWLLQDLLRDHWNWTSEQQWVTSDCDAIQNVFLPHNYTSTREEAVASKSHMVLYWS